MFVISWHFKALCRCRNTVLSKREYNRRIVWKAILGVRQSESLSKCLSAKTPWLLHFSPNISPVPLLLLLEVQQLICIRKKMGKEWHSYISIGHVCFPSFFIVRFDSIKTHGEIGGILYFLFLNRLFICWHFWHPTIALNITMWTMQYLSWSYSHPGRIWKVIFLFLKGHLRTQSCKR